MTGRILVAGVGNVFLRDDAFGVEVIRLLAERPEPPGVQIRDYGIRGVHLVYELLDGYDLFVLVDAAPRGEAPGTVSVLEVELPSPEAQPVIDAHSLTPDAIFGLLSSLGGHSGRNLVVACEPAEVDAGMGLSDPVREALPHAVRAVEEILAQATGPARQQTWPGRRRRWPGRRRRWPGRRRRWPGRRKRWPGCRRIWPGRRRTCGRRRTSRSAWRT